MQNEEFDDNKDDLSVSEDESWYLIV